MHSLMLSYKPDRIVYILLYLNDTVFGDPIPMTELASSGEYYADAPASIQGTANTFLAVFFDGATKIVSGVFNWDGSAEVVPGGATLEQIEGSSVLAKESSLEIASTKIDEATEWAKLGTLASPFF